MLTSKKVPLLTTLALMALPLVGFVNCSPFTANSSRWLNESASSSALTTPPALPVYINSDPCSLLSTGVQKCADNTRITDPSVLEAESHFSQSVAISEDGATMVIGSPGDSLDERSADYLREAGAAFVYTKSGDTWVLQQKLVASGVNARWPEDHFGTSVAISGDTIVVGAEANSTDENGGNWLSHSGAAYVYKRSDARWVQAQKLVAVGPNARDEGDRFGSSVGISGDTIVVAAKLTDSDANGENKIPLAGAAFVFTRKNSVWSLQQKLVPVGTNARAANDYFASSIAISDDTIVVGAIGQDTDENGANSLSSAGAAYVFTRTGTVWTQSQKLVATGINSRQAWDEFGTSVAISGETVIVGAPGQSTDESGANSVGDAGAAFVFTKTGSTWALQQKLVATGTNSRENFDHFGTYVAISGDSIVVGAADQDTDSLGEKSAENAGAAFAFTRAGSTWTPQQKLVAAGTNARMAYDQYGTTVAIAGDLIVASAINQSTDENGARPSAEAGAAFVLSRSAGVWSQSQKLAYRPSSVTVPQRAFLSGAHYGDSVALSEDGQTLVVGAPGDSIDGSGSNYVLGAGSVFVYTKSAGRWALQQKLAPTGPGARVSRDEFGASVAISGDTIVVGATGQDTDENGVNPFTQAGAAYVFVRSGSVWSQQQKLVPVGVDDRKVTSGFGTAVAISENLIAVGSDYRGAVYLFSRSGTTWSQDTKLTITGVDIGNAVALSGQTLVIGAETDETDANGGSALTNAGAVYVYVKSAGTWSQQQKLIASGTNARAAYDYFGASVAIRNDTIVTGAMYHDMDVNGGNATKEAGAAFVFTRSGTVWTQKQKLVASGPSARAEGDSFGGSVAIAENVIVIGAKNQDTDANGTNTVSDAGAAYVFKMRNGIWSQQEKVAGAGPYGRVHNDSLGSAVAASSTTVVVSTPINATDSQGGNPISSAGALFSFDIP